MAVVRYADHHRVDLLFQLVEHFAKIDELAVLEKSSNALPARFWSTSHMATIFWPKTPLRLSPPRPPTPIRARFSFSLGD